MREMNDGIREHKLLTDRRKFLADAGRFAVTVPPTMVLLLSTTMSSPAIAQSGRGGDNEDDQGEDEQ